MFSERAVVQFNIDPLRVGEYTPYEITLIAKQYKENKIQEFESLITLAWHTEAFARQKHLPKLERIIKIVRKKPIHKDTPGDRILKAMALEKGIVIK